MADATNYGADWRGEELDLIVADYFDMLSDEISGTPYVKARHRETLMAKIGRTGSSVELKHQNISAVLDELGMPWILGYRPKQNYQKAILDAIDRYLEKHPNILVPKPAYPDRRRSSLRDVFVDPPTLESPPKPLPESLRRLVKKYDPVERDHRNRSLGKAGERLVLKIERQWLTELGRLDLAQKVRWIAAEEGDGAGYDVLSFSLNGQERFIEVKTTNGSARTPFFITRNELDFARQRPLEWQIYRVHLFATRPSVFKLAQPLDKAVTLAPESWRACFYFS